MGMNIQGEKERCKKIIQEKQDWQDISGDQREKILSSQRAQLITADRKNICLTMDHMILDKKEFKDEWIVNFGKSKGRKCSHGGVKCTVRHRILRKAEEGSGEIAVIPIDPMQVNGFINLRSKYQYFQISKVDIRFSSNKSMNFAPILCKYFPPGTPIPEDHDPNYFAQLTKTAVAKGGDAYMSLFKPRCNVQFNIGSVNSSSKTSKATWVEMPYMSNTLMRANYDESRFALDYGYFIFVNRSSDPNQILATTEYKIDFYSGIDMNNLPESYWGGEGGDDDGEDGGDDGQGSDGEGEGDGEGDGDGSGSGKPDTGAAPAPDTTKPRNPRVRRGAPAKPQ